MLWSPKSKVSTPNSVWRCRNKPPSEKSFGGFFMVGWHQPLFMWLETKPRPTAWVWEYFTVHRKLPVTFKLRKVPYSIQWCLRCNQLQQYMRRVLTRGKKNPPHYGTYQCHICGAIS